MNHPPVFVHGGFVIGTVGAVVKEGDSNKKWMQDVKIKHPGICTGKKLGSKSCPKGSKQYALAKTFKKASKSRKK